MGDRISASVVSYLNQAFCNQGPGNRCAEKVEPFVNSIGAKHREDKIADKLLAQIFDIDFFNASTFGLTPCWLQFFTLAQIGRKGDNLAVIFDLQPF